MGGGVQREDMRVHGEETATADLPVRWPGAALDLGYHTRGLWSELQSVWAKSIKEDENGPPFVPAAVGIHHALLALDGRLNQAELAHTRTLLASIDELEGEVWEFVGGLKSEIFRTWNVKISEIDFSGLHERTERLLPGMIEQRRGLWDSKMASAWGELRLLSHRAVVGNDLLVAWWEIGFRLADVTLPNRCPGSPLAVDDEGVGTLESAIERLPAAVRPTLPAVSGVAEPSFQNHSIYLKCRSALQQHVPSSATASSTHEFEASEDYLAVRWRGREYEFNPGQAAIIKALHDDHKAGKPGLSAARLFTLTKRLGEPRLKQVFRNRDKKADVWIVHAALTDGLIQQFGAVWRLNLETR